MLVKVTHKLDLGPELPEEYKQQALKLGENPDLVPAYLDEFRNMIFGEFLWYLSYQLISNY